MLKATIKNYFFNEIVHKTRVLQTSISLAKRVAVNGVGTVYGMRGLTLKWSKNFRYPTVHRGEN